MNELIEAARALVRQFFSCSERDSQGAWVVECRICARMGAPSNGDWHASFCEVRRVLQAIEVLSTSERSTAAGESAFVREELGPAGGQAPASQFLEPWYWNEANGNAHLFDANGGCILSVPVSVSPSAGRVIARRVVAAINAASGVPTGQLEAASGDNLIEIIVSTVIDVLAMRRRK